MCAAGAGFKAEDLKYAGMGARELDMAGFSLQALKKAGFLGRQLREGGLPTTSVYSAQELRAEGRRPRHTQHNARIMHACPYVHRMCMDSSMEPTS